MGQTVSIHCYNVGKNLTSLLEQTGITIVGFSQAVGISLNHARVIMNGKASITQRTADKIASFFEIELGRLFLDETLNLNDPLDIPKIKEFYKNNEQNANYFRGRSKEKSITYLIINKLIHETIFDDWTRVGELLHFINEAEKYSKYKNIYTHKGISKALGRIFLKYDILQRKDYGKNGKVFVYRRNVDVKTT